MRPILLALFLIAGNLPTSAQVIDSEPYGHVCRGGVYEPGYGWHCRVMKVLPPNPTPPGWMRRYYGPPPDWKTPPAHCYGQPWDVPGCRGKIG